MIFKLSVFYYWLILTLHQKPCALQAITPLCQRLNYSSDQLENVLKIMSFISQTTLGGPQSSYHSILCDLLWPRTPSHRSLAHMQEREMTIVKNIIKCEGKYTLKIAMPYFGWVCKIVVSCMKIISQNQIMTASLSLAIEFLWEADKTNTLCFLNSLPF